MDIDKDKIKKGAHVQFWQNREFLLNLNFKSAMKKGYDIMNSAMSLLSFQPLLRIPLPLFFAKHSYERCLSFAIFFVSSRPVSSRFFVQSLCAHLLCDK